MSAAEGLPLLVADPEQQARQSAPRAKALPPGTLPGLASEVVGPLVETRRTFGGRTVLAYVCDSCGVMDRYDGYDLEWVRARMLARHRPCAVALGLEALAPEAPPPPPPALPVVTLPEPPAPSPPAPPLAEELPELVLEESSDEPADSERGPAPAPPPAPPAEEFSLALVPEGGVPKKARAAPKKAPPPAAPARVWSPQQEAIFAEVATGTGHIAIEALAGTGKTTTLVEIVRRLPAGARVLVLAFGKEISAELKRRMPDGTKVTTIHGLGHQALGARYQQWEPKHQKLQELLESEHFFPHKMQRPERSAVRALVSRAKATLAKGPQELLAPCAELHIDRFILDPDAAQGDAERKRRAQMALARTVNECLIHAVKTPHEGHDHDDMLFVPYALGLTLGEYDIVLVDEAQDLSRVQIEMLLRCLAPEGRAIVVGDPRQAIYGFRGADPRAWPVLLERLGAKVLPLSVTYRCARQVVLVANKEVPALEAWEGTGEGEVRSVDRIDIEQLQPGDFVISRKNAPLISMCIRALLMGKKAALVGKEVGEKMAGEIRDALEVLGPDASHGAVLDHLLGQIRDEEERRQDRGQDTRDQADEREVIELVFKLRRSVPEILAMLSTLGTEGKLDTKVAFLTAHRAKGLEATRVWLLGHTFSRGSQEERNLFYVAVTRAKRSLVFAGGSNGTV